jgi:CubicO group peptidase (beta-lactamase class C family)
MTKSGIALLLGGAMLAAASAAAQKRPVPSPSQSAERTMTKPEAEGFSSERLERLHQIFQAEVSRKQLAGAVTLLERHGKIVDDRTYGQRDLASGAPMTRDTIFRDYSMTKPVTGVAMMILYEEGKWLPSDPIAKYIPEFAHLKVFKGVDQEGKMILVDPDHPPTMKELMSHTAGFSYGSGHTVVDAMYQEKKVRQAANLQEMIDKLATIPLNYQPGQGWTYSLSMDIEGYIIERLSGQSLPDFLHEHVFAPLNMADSGFFVPSEKLARFAAVYHDDHEGQLVAGPSQGSSPSDFSSQPTMPSGGGGMVSTIDDYARFAQMLANGGQLDGVRILAPSTVKLMTSNHLGENLLAGQFGLGMSVMRPGFGYGFNCAVIFDPAAAALPDGKGTFFWDGAAGTFFWVDPTNDVVFVAMLQRMTSPDNHPLEYRTHAAVYQALLDPSK